MTSKKDELLDVAEQLFGKDGYKAVNLREIANNGGIKKASIYHHFPEGKEEIYREVHLRIFRHHGEKLKNIVTSDLSFDEKIETVTDWMISQPGMHLIPMMHLDMDNLSEDNFKILFLSLFQNIFIPISLIFEQAKQEGVISISSARSVAGGFLALLDSFDIIPDQRNMENLFDQPGHMDKQSYPSGNNALFDSPFTVPNQVDSQKFKEQALREVIAVYINGMRRDE